MFPLQNGINPHKSHSSNFSKDDAYENIKVRKPKPSKNADIDRGEYVEKKKSSSVLKTKFVTIDGKGGLKKKVGVDFNESVAFT